MDAAQGTVQTPLYIFYRPVSLPSVERNDGVRSTAIRPLPCLKYRQREPGLAIRNHSCQPRTDVCARLSFFPVVAAFAAHFCRFRWLRVQYADGRPFASTKRCERLFVRGIIDSNKGSIASPLVKIASRCTDWRNIRLDRATAFWRRHGDDRPNSHLLVVGQVHRLVGRVKATPTL